MKTLELHGTGDAWTFNRLPEALAELEIQPLGVIHVGAHLGEEVPIYQQCMFGHIRLVEPDPDNCKKLRADYGNIAAVIEAACGQRPGRAVFRKSAASVFSSLNKPRKETGRFPVELVTLRQLQDKFPLTNVAVIDTQGTELDVLRGADLDRLDLIIIETQEGDQVIGNAPASAANWYEVRGYMAAAGWIPAIQWRHERAGSKYASYADTLFVRAN